MERTFILKEKELYEIIEYFASRNRSFTFDRTRKRAAVLSRSAIVNALVKHTNQEVLGGILGIDRTTCYHYIKTHDDNMRYQDYKELFEEAVYCKNKMLTGAFNAETALFEDYESLRFENSQLRAKLNRVQKILSESTLALLE